MIQKIRVLYYTCILYITGACRVFLCTGYFSSTALIQYFTYIAVSVSVTYITVYAGNPYKAYPGTAFVALI